MDGLVENKTLKFELVNIHFHTPSEHSFDGKKRQIEGHFVHRLASSMGGDLTMLVIGVMFNSTTGRESSFLKSLKLKDLSVLLPPQPMT